MVSQGQQTPYQQLQLLNIARTLVPSGCARDTLHILLAALENPGTTGPASEVIGGIDAVRRGQLQTALKVAIDLKREQLAIGEGDRPTERLRQCEEQWQRQVLQQPTVGLTSALVLSTIVWNDQVVQGILRTCGIEPNGLYQALQQRSAIPEVPTQVFQTGPLPPAGPWTVQRAQDKALELAKPIEPSPSREYRLRHPVATEHLLNMLCIAATSQEVPIAVGRRGSPLGKLDQVLADRIASERFTGTQEALNRYRAVYRMDARSLLGLANNPTELAPDKVFEQAKQLVQQRDAILVIDHVEAWRGAGAPEALRWHLGNRGGALVCGLYTATNEPDVFAEATLGLPNATLVRINAYNADETRDFLKTYAMVHWMPSGFSFAQDAFDSIYRLEPGCWISLKRMTLPYLVVALSDQTIQTAIRGDDAIRQTAREALEGMRTVREEMPQVAEAVKSVYEPLLRQVQDDLNNLLRNPTPRANGPNPKMLTRGHVVAQLFCPNESEFHLPGFGPRSV